MKKIILLFIITFLLSVIAFGQNTYVPDDNFEQVLIDLGYDSGPLNNFVPTAGINTVTYLDVGGENISDLTGIEEFSALVYLYCESNQLTNIDVSQNSSLIYLYCNDNLLTNIDLSNNNSLEGLHFSNNNLTNIDLSLNSLLTELDCDNNQITNLDLSQNTSLIQLDCKNNQLVNLNVKNGNNTNFIEFDARYNPNLFCVEVGNTNYSTNNWTNIDAQTSFNTNCHYDDTYVPDDNFEQALIDLGLDGSLNDYVTTANINTITTLNLNNKNISDITGIEDFISLTQLRCHTNNLTSLNISTLTSLTLLQCHTNNLTSLNTSNNLNLKQLSTSQNNLTSLDLSANHLLSLFCNDNELTRLDIRNGNNADITDFNTTNNPDLTCIQVDDIGYSTTNWTNIDNTSSFSENCHYDDTYIPDNNFEQALIDLGYDTGALDNYVPTSNINTVNDLDVSSKAISDLTGIEDFTALTILNCSSNNLTSLNLSSNINLGALTCSNNNLTELNLENQTSLGSLVCQGNQITGLDLSNMPLVFLNCYSNQLTSLNVQNGNNFNVSYFAVGQNLDLTCIQVDNATYSNSNINWISGNGLYSENCHFTDTYVPDDNFEQALIDLGYDSGALDDYVPTANINSITSLNIDNKNILDETGIEDFTALTSLSCNFNNIYSLDLSNNSALTFLECNNSNITSVSLNNNTNLTDLSVSENNLTSLNLSNNISLINLYADNNSITELDLTNNIDLIEVDVSFNNLNILTPDYNINLEKLVCTDNNLTFLELSNNVALTYLDSNNNDLTRLNVKNGNNTNVTFFNTTNNSNLSCIEVDDTTYSSTNWINIDATSSFSEDCIIPETFVPDDNFENYLETHDTSGTEVPLGDASSMGNGITNDNYVYTDRVQTNTNLDIDGYNISDLTGIEDFVTLTILDCSSTQLVNLNLNQNILLETLDCSSNPLLTSLNLNQNTLLNDFTCNNTALTTLDISQNTLLETLWCSNNDSLTNINFGANTSLKHIISSSNNLGTMDVSLNSALESLFCVNNSLTSLDVSQNPNLEYINVENNQLTSLNVKNGNNANFTTINTNNNPDLSCIEVDDETYSTTNWTLIDSQTSFSEDCEAVLNIEDTNLLEKAVTIYPNPASEIIYLNSTIELDKIILYDLLGKEVLSTQETSQIKVDNIPSGMYLLKIFSENGFIVKQLIIE